MGRENDNIQSDLHYGNWCGEGWTAGQYKDSAYLTKEDLGVPAIDSLDQACKNHDIGLFYARTREQVEAVNRRFVTEASAAGIHGTIFAYLVDKFGPKEPGESFVNLPCPANPNVTTAVKSGRKPPINYWTEMKR
jgi:hypothetical protein